MWGVSNQRIVWRPSDELLAVRERARRTVREVADRHHRRELAAHGHGLRRCGQQRIQRAAFVGLEVRQPDVPQPLDGHHGAIASRTSGNIRRWPV